MLNEELGYNFKYELDDKIVVNPATFLSFVPLHH